MPFPAFALYRSPERTLDPVLRELGQTRAGWARGRQFVFSQHCKSLRGSEVSEERIAAIPAWTVSSSSTNRNAPFSPTRIVWRWPADACPRKS